MRRGDMSSFLGFLRVCLSVTLHVLAYGSLMLFISWKSPVRTLKQAAKALSPRCNAPRTDDITPKGRDLAVCNGDR